MSRRDRNYERAQAQIEEHIEGVTMTLAEVSSAMHERRPAEAVQHLTRARDGIEQALTVARWATTLPELDED